ncbi:MAG: DUF4203 domain-containing protein [candidate division WOR-3 bacterium]
MNQPAGIALVVLGITVCFLGYRLLRAVLAITGFTVGLLGATWLAGDVFHISRVWLLVCGVIGGVVGAVLSAVLYRLGVFLLGAVGGALVVVLLLPGPRPLIVLAAAVGSGIVTLLLQRALVSVITSFLGAWGTVAGALHLAGWYALPEPGQRFGVLAGQGQRGLIMLGAWVLLGIVGTTIQLSTGRRQKQK